MAIIPRGNQTVRLTPNAPVPIAGTSDARITGEAMAQFGEGLNRIGGNLLEADRRLKMAESSDRLRDIAQLSMEEATRLAKPDGSDLQDQFYKIAGPQVEKVEQDYAGFDPRLQRELGATIQRFKSNIDTDLGIKRLRMLETNNFNRLESLGERSADRIRENPNEGMLGAEMAAYNSTLSQMATTGGLSADNALKARKSFGERAALGYIEGLETQKLYGKALSFLQANHEDPNLFTEVDPDTAVKSGLIDPREAETLKAKGESYKMATLTKGDKVKLTPEMTAAMQSLAPEQKARLIDQMQAKLQEETQMRLSDMNAQLEGLEYVSLSGGEVHMPSVTKLRNEINENANLPMAAKRRAMDKINSAIAVNQQVRIAANTPRSKWDALIGKTDGAMTRAQMEAAGFDPRMAETSGDFAVQANRARNREAFKNTLAALRKRQDDDPVQTLTQGDSSLTRAYRGSLDGNPGGTQTFIRQVLAKQAYLGVPASKQKVLANDQAAQLALQFSQAKDPGMISQRVKELQAQYGDYFPRVMNEVAAENSELKGIEAAVYAPESIRGQVIDTIKNQGAINEAFKKLPRADYLQNETIRKIRSETISDFNRAVFDSSDSSGTANVVNSFQSLIELRVKNELNRNPDANIGDLVKRARKDIIDSQYEIVDGRNSTVLVPKNINGRGIDGGVVADFMTQNSSKAFYKSSRVQIPPAWKEHSEQYYEYLEENGKWVTNKDQSGLKLVRKNPNGTHTPVFDQYGKPIQRSYDAIMTKGGN